MRSSNVESICNIFMYKQSAGEKLLISLRKVMNAEPETLTSDG
jgi:hypothetical protein